MSQNIFTNNRCSSFLVTLVPRSFALMFFALLFLVSPVFADTSQSSIAVLYFTDRLPKPETKWLSAALADMLITDLQRTGRLTVVERERMQRLLNESGLNANGLTSAESNAESINESKVAQIVKADKILSGSYAVSDSNIEIEARVIDAQSGALTGGDTISGPLNDVLNLEKKLALNVADKLQIQLTPKEKEALLKKPTSSIDAATHFYNALNAFDDGRYPDSLAEALQATDRDPNYGKPRYQLGHIYSGLGEYEHAALAFEDFGAGFPQDELADDSLFYAGKILDQHLQQSERAVKVLKKAIQEHPSGELPNDTLILPMLESELTMCRRGWVKIWNNSEFSLPPKATLGFLVHDILRRDGRYDEALRAFEQACDGIAKYPCDLEERNNWIRCLVNEAYREKGETLLPKNPSIIFLNAKNPVYSEDYLTEKFREHLFQYQMIDNESGIYRGEAYYFAAPPGYTIQSVEFATVRSANRKGEIEATFGAAHDYRFADIWIEEPGPFSQRINFMPGTTLIQVGISGREKFMDPWSVKAVLSPTEPSGALTINSDSPIMVLVDLPNEETPWKRRQMNPPIAKCPCTLHNLPAGRHEFLAFHWISGTAATDGVRQSLTVDIPQTKEITFHLGAQNNRFIEQALPGWKEFRFVSRSATGGMGVTQLQLIEGKLGEYFLVWLDEDKYYFSRSSDLNSWSSAKLIAEPVNSAFAQYRFSIIHGEDSYFYAAFDSNRSGKHGLYLSRSKDFIKWSDAKLIKGSQDTGINPSLLQLHDGTFRLFNSGTLYSSDDFEHWQFTQTTALQLSSVKKDQSDRFYSVLAPPFDSDNPNGSTKALRLLSSTDGINWSAPQEIPATQMAKSINSSFEELAIANNNDLVVNWKRAYHLAFTRSKDQIHWSEATAPIESQGSTVNPDRQTLHQLSDGRWLLAFTNMNQEIWIGVKGEPLP